MQLIVGSTDFTQYVKKGGIKWSRNDVDKDSGRTLDGKMHRNRVATKIKLEVSCLDLKQSQIRALLSALMPVTVEVTYDDPLYGTVTRRMYVNNNSVTFNVQDSAGEMLYTDVSFPLIEV